MKESILQNKKELLAEKRDSLEKFIQEQMVGPGGCKYRFGLNEFSEKEEVVNTTPGSIYSTAILFPKKSDAKETESNNDGKMIIIKQMIHMIHMMREMMIQL